MQVTCVILTVGECTNSSVVFFFFVLISSGYQLDCATHQGYFSGNSRHSKSTTTGQEEN